MSQRPTCRTSSVCSMQPAAMEWGWRSSMPHPMRRRQPPASPVQPTWSLFHADLRRSTWRQSMARCASPRQPTSRPFSSSPPVLSGRQRSQRRETLWPLSDFRLPLWKLLTGAPLHELSRAAEPLRSSRRMVRQLAKYAPYGRGYRSRWHDDEADRPSGLHPQPWCASTFARSTRSQDWAEAGAGRNRRLDCPSFTSGVGAASSACRSRGREPSILGVERAFQGVCRARLAAYNAMTL